jgi:hypothetical protein
MGAFQGGLRPNKFRVNHSTPVGGAGPLTFHIRAASMPASTMTTINVPYRGRIFKMPGIRTYQTWQITVLDDANRLYELYHEWSDRIKSHYENTTSAEDYDFTDLMEDIEVTQLDYNGADFRTRTIKNAWPNNIGPLTLDMENNDTILTFTVDLEYQWFEV